MRPSLEEPSNANLHMVKISGNNISSSRTLTAIKELKNVNRLDAPHCSRPQASGESVAGPDSIKASCALKFKNLLESFFELFTSYDQARSTLIDKAEEIEKSESYIKAKEHLELVMKERDEKSEELPVAYQYLEKERKKVKKFKSLRDAAKEEVRKIESKVSTAEEEFNKCADIPLATQNASNDVDQKKQVLEDSLQDLVNYKLCLD
ncbi:hypothetical protein FXO38_07581 [Capsicum annuum]|uniref:Uncharacterized protein n=1 Tax=Capsicum annuum TaxID=4072 RepID=A0A2G2ZIX6_CAPAN|nr:hypothetical protein FXO38_07581 [Capsicum annuum]PHT81940.1 hypothetical protein T459_14955 [Capsicum annuum]